MGGRGNHVEPTMDSESEQEENLCYKQRADKPSGGEVALLKWSPTMDVIAIAFSDNSIALNRLSWQRVWSVEPAKSQVTCLSWRPDGRVLSAGYDNGSVVLYCVENGEKLHETKVGSHEVCSIVWNEDQSNKGGNYVANKYTDQSQQFLPGIPPLDNLDDANILDSNSKRLSFHPADKKKLKTVSNAMNILIAGDKAGVLHCCVSGILHTAVTSLKTDHVISMCMSHDLSSLQVLTDTGNPLQPLKYYKVDTSIIKRKKNELQYLVLKYGQIVATGQYIEETIQAMADSWEDSLLTVDRKLAQYSQDLPANLTVADEFIILLGCGKARAELQKFLVDELTASGVKKLGLSLEMSYDSIRKLLINHISRAIQAMDFYLHEVLGVANWNDVFGDLGVPSKDVQKALQALGSFALKYQELLFLIDHSLRHLKIFFTWLYSIILKLSGEPVPPVVGESFTVEDLGIITEFLNNRFRSESSRHDQTFSLERVGQYFMNEDLKFVDDSNCTPSLLETVLDKMEINGENIPWIIKPLPQKSLRQLFDNLMSSIATMFGSLKHVVGSQVQATYTYGLATEGDITQTASFINSCGVFHSKDNSTIISYYPINDNDIVVLLHTENTQLPQAGRFFISNSFNDAPQESLFRIITLSHYNSNTLSVLFANHDESQQTHSETEYRNRSVWYGVAQVPVNSILSSLVTTTDTTELSQDCLKSLPRNDLGPYLKQIHHLNKFPSKMASFSGPRRLAAVVSSNCKRVRLFDVDYDVEEEEGDAIEEDEAL